MAAVPQIAVIGAGITGGFAALFAAQAGADVIVVERDLELRNASTQNPGGLNPIHGLPQPSPVSALALASVELHRQLWPRLREVGAGDFGGREARRLHVAIDLDEAERLTAEADHYLDVPGFSSRWLDAAAARAVEPRLSANVVGGLDVTGNLRVDARPYTAAIAAAAVAAGAVWQAAEVTGVRRDGDAVTALVTRQGDVRCDQVIVATGPWTAGPDEWFGSDLPVFGVQGELLLVAAPAAPAVEVSRGQFGVYPNADGTAWLGGTEQRAIEARPTDAGRRAVLDGVASFMTGLADATVICHTAALRPVTADGLPIIGHLPGWSNVVAALGAGRKGMLLSAGLGRAAADLACHGTTDLPIEGLGVNRR